MTKHIYKLENADKTTFYSPVEAKATSAPTSKFPEGENLWLISGLQCTC